MEKMKMKTLDIVNENVKKIGEIFPECIKENKLSDGTIEKRIDFDILRQMLSKDIIENNEKYEFTWVGKHDSIIEANKTIRLTLRPKIESSINWNGTRNIYIEGKNIESLKLLQESYLKKVKMIYIDPPYNTGNNIIYPNDYSISQEDYDKNSNIYDEDGNTLFKNTDSNGRFHSDWCSMIFSVLLLSRNMLTDDGYIAIAMDDNELFTLKLMCDEVFGESNFIGTLVTRSNPQGRNKNNLDPVHEYHLLYAKDILLMENLKIKKNDDDKEYRYLMRSGTNSRKNERPYRFYPMLEKDGKVFIIEKDEYESIYAKNKKFDSNVLDKLKEKYESLGYKYILPISKDGEEKVWQRTFERVSSEYETYIYDGNQIKIPPEDVRTPISLWDEDRYSNVQNGTNKLKLLFGGKTPFDFSKSVFTVQDLISLNTKDNDIILDFFSGSATTGQAVMQLNEEDEGHRKYILIQVPEPIDEKETAYKMGYKNICEIGEDRLRRAGKRIKEENPLMTQDLDIGFRVFKVDSSNMKDVYYSADEYNQDLLSSLESNIKEDRTDLDLLFGCVLDWGLPLDLPYTSEDIDGCIVHNYNDGDLIACFNKDVPESVIKAIAKKKPLKVVFRDDSFKDSPSKINVEEIFKLLSPDTSVKVI